MGRNEEFEAGHGGHGDLEFHYAMDRLLDVIADTATTPTLKHTLADPAARGRIMDGIDGSTPRYAPGTFERHVDDQMKGAK